MGKNAQKKANENWDQSQRKLSRDKRNLENQHGHKFIWNTVYTHAVSASCAAQKKRNTRCRAKGKTCRHT